MSNRTKDYHRAQRDRIIRNRKQKSKSYYGQEYYPDDNRYSKGKIFCSCWRCRSTDHRKRHIFTRQELITLVNMEEEIKLYDEFLSKGRRENE